MADNTPNMTDYEAERRDFRLDVPEHFNFGFDVIDKWAEDRTKLALISVAPDGESAQKHSFWDLKVQSNKFANLLASLGVDKGERAFFMGPRVPEWYVATLGMIKAGVIPMPATTLLTPHDIEYRVTLADATVAIVDLENAHKVEEVVADCPTLERIILLDGSRRGWVSWQDEMDGLSASYEPAEPTRSDDDMIIYFTSGTVGQPKMVLHTQASYAIAHKITARFWHDLKSTDVHWAIADTGWAKTAYGKLFGQWTEGAAVLQHNAQGRFDPDLTLRILTRYGVSAFCAPPTVYRMMVLGDLSKYDLSSLSHCTGAGEPLNPEVIKSVGGRHRPHYLRRLRPDGNGAAGWKLPLHAREARLDGPAHTRLRRRGYRRGRRRARAEQGGADRGSSLPGAPRRPDEGVLARQRRDGLVHVR